VAEQRYQAVLAVISDGLSVSQVASKFGVSRQTLHSWLARYEEAGLEGLMDRSHRPASCPHQMPAGVEAALLELRRSGSVVGSFTSRHRGGVTATFGDQHLEVDEIVIATGRLVNTGGLGLESVGCVMEVSWRSTTICRRSESTAPGCTQWVTQLGAHCCPIFLSTTP
jgi:transposase-like protein